MATTSRSTSVDVIDHLHAKPEHFSHVQAIRLLRWQAAQEGVCVDDFVKSRIRTRPELSLAFQPTELAELDIQDNKTQLTATFMGLYGAASPLPTFYTEELFEEARNDASESRDFLDIVNQVFFHQYFEAWSKYRLLPQVVEEKKSQVIERLLCLAGVSLNSIDQDHAQELIRYAGILSQVPRSALGMSSMIADAVGAQVDVEELVGKWERIPDDQLMSLGERNHSLGEDAYLGSEILDYSGGCILHIHTDQRNVFHGLLPGGHLFRKMKRLLRHYLVEPIEIEMKIWPQATISVPSILGNVEGVLLGFDACLGQQSGAVSVPLFTSEEF
ncbi:type VI secretion system baseplate subunit TssG [Vibrio sp. S4M6]|uniref:type VI secretion system baseplate subunit TssG n=1 Tax=Vibrio sinus TaxID=2946865 RepID=UPI00202A0664|nr:type VI secretion system baseplate subunit TssG [Vibrio sinus]MCL9782504.1 type VI secretion system baseplate subunit TssG [Vibrio sinus]